MATRKPQTAPLPSALPDEIVWLAAALVAELGVLIEHDGERLPATGAAHLASEIADDVLAEFHRRFRK